MAEQNVSQATTRQFYNPVFREIHKNTWLKKVSKNDSKKKRERVWVVFCVHDDTEAYLESYVDNKSAVLHKPDWYVCLNDTQHVSPTICAHDQDYEFVITLANEVIRLAAPSWEAMLDWVESLRVKLHELKILTPKDNLYSKLPENRGGPLLPTRDPTSPLPPPPAVPPALLPGIEPITPVTPIDRTDISHYNRRHNILQRGLSLPETSSNGATPETHSGDSATIQTNIFNFENVTSVLNETTAIENPSNYERLFQAQQSPGPSSRHPRPLRQPPPPSSPRLLQAAPEPSLTLREHQVLQLQKEMKHPGGVRLLLRKKDCISSIALVDAFNSIWVSGWKQKENPTLYNVLHIGDQLLAIEGSSAKSAADAQKVLRSSTSIYVHIIVKRVPHGQVYVIHRETEGQFLGLVQEGNTAVIASVQPESPAARQGVPARARTCDGLSFTNWVLTEINGRPLNLFFKENQVRDRLNSVGRDISILVQPLDLIKQLKKQLKSLKNYKDYILQ